MYQPKKEEDIRCALEYGLNIFGGKWNARIICVLHNKGTLRYSEIRKEMHNITDAVLAATLKDLLKEDIIVRKQYDVIPPRVEYSLSKKGLSIVPIMGQICLWAGQYFDDSDEDASPLCQRCKFRKN